MKMFHGKIIEVIRYRELPAKKPVEKKPDIRTKMRRLISALKHWQKAGRPVATKDERSARITACRKCEYWRPEGNFFMGECRAPGCGCTKFKVILASERCTHPLGSRWPTNKFS